METKPIWESAPDKNDHLGRSMCVLPECAAQVFCKRLCTKHYQGVYQGRIDPATGLSFKDLRIKSGEQAVAKPATKRGYPKSFNGYDKYVWLMQSAELLDIVSGVRLPLRNAIACWGPQVKEDVLTEKFKHYLGEVWDPDPDFKLDNYYNSYKESSMLKPEDVGEPMHPSLMTLLANIGQHDTPWLLDWLAYKINHPWECTGALVIHGVQGAGKGTLESVMKALFGDQCSSIDSLALGTDFNNWADRKFMIIADEINVSTMRDKEIIRKQLKKYTAPNTLLINKKYSNAFNITNHASWIICGNDERVIDIEQGDRRYSVLRVPAPINEDLGAEISNDAVRFAKNLVNSLWNREIKHYVKGKPLDNAARRVMQNQYRHLKVVTAAQQLAEDSDG